MATDLNPSGPTPRPRTATRRARRARLAFRRWPLGRRAAASMVVAALGLALLAGWASWFAGAAVTELERTENAQLADQIRGQVRTLVAKDEQRLREAAFSDVIYADVGRLAERRDTTYRPPFAERFAWTGPDRFVAMYGLDGQSLYRWSTAAFDSLTVSNAVFRMLDNREPAAGLLRQGDQLLWIAGAPILPGGGTAEPIRGYLVTARPISGRDLAPSAGGTSPVVDIEPVAPAGELVATTIASFAAGDSMRVEFTLPDVFAVRNSRAVVRASRARFRTVESRFQLLLVGTLGMLGGLAVAGWLLIDRWLVGPARRLAAALEPINSGTAPTLLSSVSSAREWRSAVGSVNRLLASSRTSSDRFQRLFSASRDGVWEYDPANATWTISRRVAALLGYETVPLPDGSTLEDLAHADDRERVRAGLDAIVATGAPLSLEVRLQRLDGSAASFRVEAEADTDQTAQSSVIVGRIVPLEEEHAARDALAALREESEQTERATGRFLQGLAHRASGAEYADDLEFIARGLAGDLEIKVAAFDLHHLLQELAGLATPPAQVAVAPGVPTRVESDRAMLERALRPIVDNAVRAGGPLWIRAERLSGAGPDTVRLVVENQRGGVDAETRERMETLMTTGGEPAGADNGALGLRVSYRAVAALGGTAGIDTHAEAGTQVWIVVELPTAAQEFAESAPVDLRDQSLEDWTDPGPWTTAQEPARLSGGHRKADPGEPKVELVADATVTIDFDAPAPEAVPIGAEFLDQVLPGPSQNDLAVQMATIFLRETPVRLASLHDAAGEGELATVRSLAKALRSMASLVSADTVVAACDAISLSLDASDPAELESAIGRLDHAIDKAAEALQPVAQGAPQPPTGSECPAIEPATLDQLRASQSGDGTGMGGQLVSLFLAEAPLRLAALDRAGTSGDTTTITNLANDLHGMCTLVGAGPMADLCRQHATSTDETRRSWVAALRAEFSRAEQTLESVLHARTSA